MMNSVIIKIGISQLQKAILKQEKENNSPIEYVVFNEPKKDGITTGLAIWKQANKSPVCLDTIYIKDFLGKVDKKSLSSIIPASILPMLPDFDLKLVKEFMDTVTSCISRMEEQHKGSISIHIFNKKARKISMGGDKLMIKLLLYRTDETSHVIKSSTLQDFAEDLLVEINSGVVH